MARWTAAHSVTAMTLLLGVVVGPGPLWAQAPTRDASLQLLSQAAPADGKQYRKLDPDAMIVVPPSAQAEDTVIRRDFTSELSQLPQGKALNWTPKSLATSDTLGFLAKSAEIRRDVWSLEFSFKPVRLIEIPSDGSGETRQAMYVVYRVRDIGGHFQATEDKESGIAGVKVVDGLKESIRARLSFELYSHEFKKCYPEEHAPAVVAAVQQREDPNRTYLTTRQMALQRYTKGTEVWGVAVWNVKRPLDPRMDFFSVYVRGLTNAYAEQIVSNETRLLPKTLQINFWRPGDALELSEEEFRYGVPPDGAEKYGLIKPAPHRWTFLKSCASRVKK